MSTTETSPPTVGRVQQVSALGLVFVPLVAVGYAALAFWHHGIGWLDLILAVTLYLITGHGLTVGFHRMLTHGSFRPARALKVALVIAGSMASRVRSSPGWPSTAVIMPTPIVPVTRTRRGATAWASDPS